MKHSLLTFTAQVLIFWYLFGMAMELVFPGFLSNYISLDIFLWIVILIAVIAFFFSHKSSR